MDKKTIKELYNCSYIEENGYIYPLQKWYNELIDKYTSEITVVDVLKMIRQRELIDLAILKSIDFLKYNSLAGELYDGELLTKLYTVNNNTLQGYFDEIRDILSKALIQADTHEWLCEDEKVEFKYLISKFTLKINDQLKD